MIDGSASAGPDSSSPILHDAMPMSSDRAPETLEEAAEEFERILVRTLVQSMTDGLFENSMGGDDTPGWMDSQRSSHQDIMNDVLSSHLVEAHSLSIADQLVQQWEHVTPGGALDEAESGAEGAPLDPAPPLPPDADSNMAPDAAPGDWTDRPTRIDLSSR